MQKPLRTVPRRQERSLPLTTAALAVSSSAAATVTATAAAAAATLAAVAGRAGGTDRGSRHDVFPCLHGGWLVRRKKPVAGDWAPSSWFSRGARSLDFLLRESARRHPRTHLPRLTRLEGKRNCNCMGRPRRPAGRPEMRIFVRMTSLFSSLDTPLTPSVRYHEQIQKCLFLNDTK
jgi:hypothetical protein